MDILRFVDFMTPNKEIGVHKSNGTKSHVDTSTLEDGFNPNFMRVNEWNSWKNELQMNIKKKNLSSSSTPTSTRSRETKTFG